MRDGIIEDTPVAQCATGCRVRGQHQGDCTNPCGGDCDRRCVAHCRGCRPKRAAANLTVCSTCAAKLRRALVQAPRLVAWIGVHDVPSSEQREPDESSKKGKKTPPLPFRADAVDTADEIHALLCTWAHTIVDEHPGALRGPDLSGSVRARRVLADRTGDVIGLAVNRGWGTGDTVPPAMPTERAASWLLTHSDWALARPWADAFVTEISEAVFTAQHRWPTTEEVSRLPTACHVCGRMSLVRYAPAYPGATARILCEHSECGEVIPEDRYDFYAELYQRQQKRRRVGR